VKRAALYLKHIRECIERIERYCRDGRAAFEQDTQIQDSVARVLQTLAESTTHLPNELRDRFPEVDWRSIRAFRNVLVHDYLHVDMDTVWDIVELDIPILKGAVERMLVGLKLD
jgi:uncharacterized protein with HEPN domain